jgi:hypothetical protein
MMSGLKLGEFGCGDPTDTDSDDDWSDCKDWSVLDVELLLLLVLG